MTTTLLSALVPAQQFLMAQEQQFQSVLSDDRINFAKECQFALQHLSNNDFTRQVAMKNQESFRNAIINVAAIGISLNPAAKLAYLVPRKGAVCLDIGYLGLEHLAIESGSVLWVQTKLVHANDTYVNTGINTAPEHQYSAFGKRGDIVGCYCVAKVHDGSFLTEEMSIEEIHRIRGRSESFTKGSMSPWKTDEGEMIRKTVIKRASKHWPKRVRLDAAIDMLNRQGEGIDFHRERAPVREKAISPATEEQVKAIREGLEFISRPEDAFLKYFSGSIAKRVIESIEELTEEEAIKAISTIQSIMDKQAEKQSGREVF